MDAFDHTAPMDDVAQAAPPPTEAEREALWFALEADRRARDERTARLRAMRLIGGEDEAA
jgi:hypothetical protein